MCPNVTACCLIHNEDIRRPKSTLKFRNAKESQAAKKGTRKFRAYVYLEVSEKNIVLYRR